MKDWLNVGPVQLVWWWEWRHWRWHTSLGPYGRLYKRRWQVGPLEIRWWAS